MNNSKAFANSYSKNQLARLGLGRNPFFDADDHRFFLTRDLEQLLKTLRQISASTDTLVLVEGEKGIGKSTFSTLFCTADGAPPCQQMEAHPLVVPAQLCQQIRQLLGPADEEKAVAHLLKDAGQVSFLLIDDAHELSVECLEYLFGIAALQRDFGLHSLVIVLLAESSIRSAIHELTRAGKYPPPVGRRLRPLTKTETGDYVADRIRQAALTDAIVVSPLQQESLWYLSRGVPEKLNYHSSKLLPQLISLPHTELELEHNRRRGLSTAILAVAACAFLVTLIYRSPLMTWLNPGEVATDEPEVLPAAAPLSGAIVRTPDTRQAAAIPATEKPAGTPEEAVVVEHSAGPRADERTEAPITLLAGERRLMAAAEDGYTLQLLGVRNEAAMREFVAEHGIAAHSHVYRSLHEGETIYLLVYGLFDNKQAADDARAKLPAGVASRQTWVKPLARVQDEIRHRMHQQEGQAAVPSP